MTTEKRLPEGWFPIRNDLVRRPEFAALTVSQKVCLFDTLYYLNRHMFLSKAGYREGPFTRGDSKWAERLRMSVEAFRIARRKIGQPLTGKAENNLGWFTYKPGYRGQNGKTMATEYYDCKFATPGRGVQSGALARYTWYQAVKHLKQNVLDHAELVACAMLAYHWKISGGRENGSAVIPKGRITTTTGMSTSTFLKSLQKLHQVMPDLFSLENGHKYLDISNWTGGPDATAK